MLFAAAVSTPSATTSRPEVVGEVDDRAGDRRVLAVVREVGDEGAVDLDVLERKVAEEGEGGVAATEVVEGEFDAEPSELLEDGLGAPRVVRQGALGDFEQKTRRVEWESVEEAGDGAGEVRVAQIAHREVDSDIERCPALVPLPALLECRLDDVACERVDEAGLFGGLDELAGWEEASGWMLPTQESFDAFDGSVAEIELGLVVEDELALVERASQLADQLEAALVVAVVLGPVVGMAGPGLFGLVESDIGVLEELVCAVGIGRVAGDADARLGAERKPFDQEGLLQELFDPFEGAGARSLDALPAGREEDPELVAAEPGERVGVAEPSAQRPGEPPGGAGRRDGGRGCR